MCERALTLAKCCVPMTVFSWAEPMFASIESTRSFWPLISLELDKAGKT